jgi:hypothetical protein
MIAAKPTSERLKVPMTDVKSSGIEPPAAIKVAPATSGEMPNSLVSPMKTILIGTQA